MPLDVADRLPTGEANNLRLAIREPTIVTDYLELQIDSELDRVSRELASQVPRTMGPRRRGRPKLLQTRERGFDCHERPVSRSSAGLARLLVPRLKKCNPNGQCRGNVVNADGQCFGVH